MIGTGRHLADTATVEATLIFEGFTVLTAQLPARELCILPARDGATWVIDDGSYAELI